MKAKIRKTGEVVDIKLTPVMHIEAILMLYLILTVKVMNVLI